MHLNTLPTRVGPARVLSGCAVLACLCLPAALAAQTEVPAVVKEGGCLSCHDVKSYKAGPPFKSVAAKYKNNREAGEKRITSALKDGYGHPKTSVAPDQLKSIIDWVLAL